MIKILKRKPFSDHPEDHYLEVVLAERNNEYVTWEHNKEDGGYFLGHYFETLQNAEKDFRKR